MFDDGEFDVCTLFYSEFKSVISAGPDRPAADPGPAGGEAKATDEPIWAVLRVRAGRGEILEDLLPRNISVQIFRALLENAAGPSRARACPRWTTPRAMPAR
jgi:F-type H+-transporting ATPase subunit gamma